MPGAAFFAGSATDIGVAVDIPATERLIWSVYDVYKSPVFGLVQRRVLTEERHGSSTHWTELIHVVGRLMAYKQAIDVSFMARNTWPQLFEDFDITMVPSSTSATKVLNNKVMTAKAILHKLTSEEEILEELYAGAEKNQTLQGVGLDEEIKTEWLRKPKDGVYVHAEINLLQYLERTEGGTEDSRFFQGIKFIGTSKPPCKLCAYFFQAYPTDVAVRSSSLNLYSTWLMPEIFIHQPNTRGGIDTLKVARTIRGRLLDDLLQTFRSGEKDGRPNDSSNYSTRRGPQSQHQLEDMSNRSEASNVSDATEVDGTGSIALSPSTAEHFNNPAVMRYFQAQASIDELTANMRSMSLPPSQPTSRTALTPARNQVKTTAQTSCPTTVVIETDDEDEDGGVLLFHGRRSQQIGNRSYG